MHICHIITRLIVGGAQENTILTCRHLVERGHRVTLIAGTETGPEGSLWSKAQRCGAEIVKLEAMRRRIDPLHDWRAVRFLRRWFRDRRPAVVHTHSSKAGIIGRHAARRAGVPVIIHTIHGMSFNRTQPAPVRALYRFLERGSSRCCSKIVTVADAMIDQAVAAGLAPRERFLTIRSGMETEKFFPDPEARSRVRARWDVPQDAVVVGTVARLFRHKGFEEILKALPRMVAGDDRIRFVWVGDGKHRPRYERQLEASGLRDRVRLLGLIGPDEVPECMNGFDIVLHASRWEGLPRAVVQGLLTEVPAVSFDNDGAPEVVIPEETGLLVPLGRTDLLADAVLTLARDPALRKRLGCRGRRRCIDLFDWRKMGRELERLYESIIDVNPGRRERRLHCSDRT